MTWFNGKKTAIGFICLAIAGGLNAFFSSTEMHTPEVMQGIIRVLEYAGYLFGGVGVTHKKLKSEL